MRFIRGHAFVHLLSHVDTASYVRHIFLVLVSAALLGVGRWGRFYSHSVYTFLLERLAYSHWVYFSFTIFSLKHWIFDFSVFSAMYDLDSLLRALFLRVLLRVQYLRRFWRVFRNGMVKLAVISIWAWFSDPPIFFLVSALFAGLLFSDCVCLEFIVDFFLLFPFVQEAQKLLEGLLRTCEQFPWRSSPCLHVLYFCNKEGLHGISSLISYVLTLVAVFLLSYVEEDIIE